MSPGLLEAVPELHRPTTVQIVYMKNLDVLQGPLSFSGRLPSCLWTGSAELGELFSESRA